MKLTRKRGIAMVMAFALVFATFHVEALTATAAGSTTEVIVTGTYDQTGARSMLNMINEFRTGSDAWYYTDETKTTKETLSNLQGLTYDYNLEQIAMQRAAEIALSYSHTRPDGSRCFTATYNGTSSWGENIAAGNITSANSAFVLWREDDYGYSGQGHRRNMLKEDFTAVGIAHIVVNGAHYWVQEFGYTDSGAAATTANDSATSVPVTMDISTVKSLAVELNGETTYNLSQGKTIASPTVKVSVSTNDTYPSFQIITYTVTPEWIADKEGIVSVSNGIITALADGSVKLTATIVERSVTVTINVTGEDSGNTGNSGNTEDSGNTSDNTPETSEGTVTPQVSGNSNSITTATGTATVAAAVQAIATTSSVNGVKSTVNGAFLVKKVNGVAFTTSLADITAGYGLASGEKVYAMVWDLNPQKSYLAQQVIDNAAAALGAEMGPALNIELGKKNAAGKYSLLSQDGPAVTIKVGIPASFAEEGKTYAVVCVRPGGAVSILADMDADVDTVTFATTGGAGAYAIVKY